MAKKRSTIVVLSVLSCLLLVYLTPHSNAQSNPSFITGQALDDATNQPIKNATVSVWKSVSYGRSGATWNLIETAKTNVNGQFIIKVDGGFQCQLYVYFNDPSSPGFDYAPVSGSFRMPDENITFSIRLLPAASIIFDGDLWFVESTSPLTSFSYNIEDDRTGPSTGFSYVKTYGTSSPSYDFLGLPPNLVVVPIDRKTSIRVSASSSTGERVSKSFVINDIEQPNLTKGSLARVNIEKYSTWVNYDSTISNFNAAAQLLLDVDQKGFHVAVEKQDLTKAESLISLAKTELDNCQFKPAYTDLREAYIKIVDVKKSLESVYANALASTSLLTLFLSLTALSLSYVLFERLTLKMSVYPLFFIALFSVFYFAYPACPLVSAETLLNGVFTSLGVSLLITLIFPRFLKDRIISTFSLAKRNLRRRKTRFLLTLLTVTALVISFVSLTSFTQQYGLTTESFSHLISAVPQGLLIQQPLPDPYPKVISYDGYIAYIWDFTPIKPSSIELFKKNSEILLIASKAENQPRQDRRGSLIQPSTHESIPIYGILGIEPSAESEITHIDRVVVKGRFLRDDDENSILLCDDAAMRMGVEVNDKLVLNIMGRGWTVDVVGLFDGNLFCSMKDIDREGITPNKLVAMEGSSLTYLTPCEPNEFVVTTLEFSLKLPDVYLSRVDTLIRNPEKGSYLTREIALEQGFSVWYSSGKEVFHALVGSFIESRGVSIFIPLVIVILNVVMTMLNSIYEYRREITILSSVGLNPSDIMELFVAEAAVIGIVGGGLGYLAGISNYKVMAMASIVVEVRPKVSAVWSFASVLVSVSAVLVGAFVALHSSVVITPSMLRRWKVEKGAPSVGEPWVFDLPFRLRKEELNSLFDYVTARFRGYLTVMGIDENIGGIRYSEDEHLGTSMRRVHFNYHLGQKSRVGSFPFQLVARSGKGEEAFSFEVVCRGGSEETIKETVSFVRMSMIEWSANQTR